MRVRQLALAVAATVVLAAGCSSGHRSAAPGPSSRNHGPDPDVVPAVITAAYVNSVFAVLNHIDGNATRGLVTAGKVTSPVKRLLRAIYNDPLYGQELKIAQQSLQGGTSEVRKPPGDVVTKVVTLVSASGQCIFVSTDSNFGAVLRRPDQPVASEYWVLRPKQPGDDPDSLNPTPWALSFNADYLRPTSIPDQCAGG